VVAFENGPGHGFTARAHRAVLTGASAAKCRQGLHLDLLHGTSYKPQHGDLGEGGRREVLTGEAVGVAAADGIEGENSS
jgi:hypothetical protein